MAAPGKPNRSRYPRSIWLVGGGPSLRGFDFAALHGEYVITVNDSFRVIPWADAVCSLDSTWIRARKNELQHFGGDIYLGIRRGSNRDITDARTGTLLLEFVSEPGLSKSWHCLHAVGSSGYFAMQVAYLMKPRFIGLLGFDYKNPGTHHHREYEWPSGQPADTWAEWGNAFGTCVDQIHAAGIEVINFGDSGIAHFEKQPLSEVRNYLT